MYKRFVFTALVIFCFYGAFLNCTLAEELVTNPTFRSTGEQLPKGWSVWKPVLEKTVCKYECVDEGLMVESAQDPYAVGGIVQQIKDIKPGQAYKIKAICKLNNISEPYYSILVRIIWLNGDKYLHPAGMLVRGPMLKADTASFDDVLIAPQGADKAQLSLEVKWPGDGSVVWKKVSVQTTVKPMPRKVKIGTVYLKPRRSTPEKNLKLWSEQIDQAGRLELDVVCLGEAITIVGTGASVKDCAEPIPGPATEQLAKAAKKNNIWVVAGLTEQVGDTVYNTAVLFDRKGKIAGRYRKVHLPREEWKLGVRPGYEYPVFETDFGKIAIQICYDWFFPEAAEIFALEGAEIIFAPTWGNTLPDHAGKVDGESVFRVRARDNGVYMVPSVYDGNSLVIDPMGKILANSAGKTGVFWAEADLNTRENLDWVGYWRSIGPRHRMTNSYGPLFKTPVESKY
ncbi:MAG: carbon-nitrogen hydrolase family protein [Sedimentisphaerales bacterium]|nr:carbon-nitrogen hydrolase family protein [Sedimentisphaerales bacterium]